MELMQGYVKENGMVGIDDLSRWPSDCLSLDFLSETTHSTNIDSLLKVIWALNNLRWFRLTLYSILCYSSHGPEVNLKVL